MLMNANSKQTARCTCGYDRAGLENDALCPECGLLDLANPDGWFKTLWSTNRSSSARASCIFGFANLALALLVTLSLPILLFAGGGGGANMGFIYPGLAWMLIISPVALITVVFAIIPSPNGHWPLALFGISLAVIAVGMPALLFLVIMSVA